MLEAETSIVYNTGFTYNRYETTTQQEIESNKHKTNLVKSSISLWTERSFLSSNAKDIGTLSAK